jgi:hypothetical protein
VTRCVIAGDFSQPGRERPPPGSRDASVAGFVAAVSPGFRPNTEAPRGDEPDEDRRHEGAQPPIRAQRVADFRAPSAAVDRAQRNADVCAPASFFAANRHFSRAR